MTAAASGSSGGTGGGGSGQGGGTLAYTGEPVGRLIPIGLLLLLAGAGLLVLPGRVRRRRSGS
ncbi:hypothetical protein [Nakamurella deserti]|uniref:hypothetical protein n=1 Tax=Nakamurella deserti TaxID=2164074 RepID=UPI000DBE1EC0|nr:hypothetical protein [Nakamurella deserti]